jgi:hypothetical protein
MADIINHPAFDREPVINTRKLGGCPPKGVRVLSRYRSEKKTQEAEARIQATFNGAKAKEARERRLEELKKDREENMRRACTASQMISDLERERESR